jgi:putative transposase
MGRDAMRGATTGIVRTCAHVVLKNLSVHGILANRKPAEAIADVAFYKFRRQVEYKAKLLASEVTLAPRFFPSSKMGGCPGLLNDHFTLFLL